jgi:Ca2+-transporting ATPase
MITGDQASTAAAIGEELGLSQGRKLEILDCSALNGDADEILAARAARTHVFARVSPSHKLHVVRALKRDGAVVAMVGDGVNDAPALKAADIGVAMGRRGSEVAREAADVVLLEDNLADLMAAVEMGRTTYANIRKSVHYLLSTNLSEALVELGATSAGLPEPLGPLPLLWLNLVTDVFPALALSLEPTEEGTLRARPRSPSSPLVERRDYRRIGIESLLMTAGTLASYAYGLGRYGPGPRARTLAFANLSAAQLLHTLSSRSERHSVFDRKRLPANPFVPAAVGAGLTLQGVALLVPAVRRALGIQLISPGDGVVSGGLALGNFLVNEWMNLIARSER